MKGLRKSVNSDSKGRQVISTPVLLPAVSKPPSSIAPPQKVIRALAAYRPQAPQELPFSKGDFFYVIKDVDANGAWYEAHNPVSGARGLVPRSMFEEFSKAPPPVRTTGNGAPSPSQPSSAAPKSPKSQVFYAIVLHDFVAERADELAAKAGEPISVVAQSNREWFVAKPIGKLGRPGLIPVSFVEVRDPASNLPISDINALMDRGDLPRVEDWKKAMFSYKQNSIALGVLDDASNKQAVQNSPFMPKPPSSLPQPPPPPPSTYSSQTIPHPYAAASAASQKPPTQNGDPTIQVQEPSPRRPQSGNTSPPLPRIPSPIGLPEGILLSADVVSFHYENEEYWFRVDAIYQPYDPSNPGRLPPAKQLFLFRVYNDFYDFQVTLLNRFPREAGRVPPAERILPYMPGPSEHVNQEITASRRGELDEYIHRLCDLSSAGARYILEDKVVREFLIPKPGDVDNPIEPRSEEIAALEADNMEQNGREDDYTHHVDAMAAGEEYEGEMRDQLGRMRVGEQDAENGSYGASKPVPGSRINHPYGNSFGGSPVSASNVPVYAQNHQRTGSNASFGAQSPYLPQSTLGAPSSRSQSPNTLNPATRALVPRRPPVDTENRSSEYSRASNSPRWPDSNATTPVSAVSANSAQGPMSRSRSGSTTANLNNPPISASNSQTAFIKIKIFDQMTDDLIAIRVHPLVSHAELLEKVQSRLGGDVAHLRYQDSNRQMVELSRDRELREWLESTDKHVLYAE